VRSFEYAYTLPAVPWGGDGRVTQTPEKGRPIRHRLLTCAARKQGYFLKSLSKASRASLALRGGGELIPCGIRPPGICVEEASRATVTRGENKAQSFC